MNHAVSGSQNVTGGYDGTATKRFGASLLQADLPGILVTIGVVALDDPVFFFLP